MALLGKKKKVNNTKETPFEDKKGLDKLCIYFTIVSAGQGDAVIDLLKYVGSSAQYIQRAVGTAPSDLMNILNISDNKKEVVVSFIKESLLDEAQRQIDVFFKASKRNEGIAFAVPLNSIIGVRAYKFLSKTL